jgi:hypothetical protein
VTPHRIRAGGAVAVGRIGLAVLVVLITSLVAACAGPTTSFSPTGECLVDGRAVGAYPELEALVPRDLRGAAPTSVDSGRSCTERSLGTLSDHGIDELRFAGAIWDEGEGAGTSIALLARPAETGGWTRLPVAWAEELYESGARASTKTSNIETSRPTIGGVAVWRLDTLNDLSQQTVLVRPLGDLVQVVLVATHVDPGASLAEHERRVELAVVAATAGSGSAEESVVPSPG